MPIRIKAFRGDRVRDLREAKELTQQKLAVLCDTTPVQISKYELGAIEAGWENAVALATALDTTLDYLAGRTDDPKASYSIPMGDTERELLEAYRDGDTVTMLRITLDVASRTNRAA